MTVELDGRAAMAPLRNNIDPGLTASDEHSPSHTLGIPYYFTSFASVVLAIHLAMLRSLQLVTDIVKRRQSSSLRRSCASSKIRRGNQNCNGRHDHVLCSVINVSNYLVVQNKCALDNK